MHDDDDDDDGDDDGITVRQVIGLSVLPLTNKEMYNKRTTNAYERTHRHPPHAHRRTHRRNAHTHRYTQTVLARTYTNTAVKERMWVSPCL